MIYRSATFEIIVFKSVGEVGGGFFKCCTPPEVIEAAEVTMAASDDLETGAGELPAKAATVVAFKATATATLLPEAVSSKIVMEATCRGRTL